MTFFVCMNGVQLWGRRPKHRGDVTVRKFDVVQSSSWGDVNVT